MRVPKSSSLNHPLPIDTYDDIIRKSEAWNESETYDDLSASDSFF